MDYHMQFLEFFSLHQKHGLSYAFYGISVLSPKTWTIIFNFWNFYPFFQNVDYHMQVSKIPFPPPKTWTIIFNLWNFFLFSLIVNYHMLFLELLSLKKHGLSLAISGISITSAKTWSIICSFWNFFPFSINVDYHMQVS